MTQLCFDFADGDEGLLVTKLREGATNGLAVCAVAKQLGVSRVKAIRYARRAGIRYKHQHQTAEAIERAVSFVTDDDLPTRAAAERSGLSKTALNRFIRQRRQKAVDAAGPIRFKHAAQIGKNQRVWTCPTHGKVTVWPCVACLAENAR